MEILNNFNKVSKNASEYEMQEQIDLFLKSQRFLKKDAEFWEELPKIVLREFRVPEIGRISDHVLLINGRRVVNIECKLSDFQGVLSQAGDHLKWCDYSVICMPPDQGYFSSKNIKEAISKGIGVWFWFRDVGIFEFVYPKFNRSKDMELRRALIGRVKEKGNDIQLKF